MNKEIERTGAEEEKKEKLNGRKIAYRFSDDQEGDFKIALLSPTASDEINIFVREELQRIDESIKELSQKISEASSKKRHGQRPSVRRVGENRENWEGMKNDLFAKKMVLSGEANSPIVLVKKDDEITGSNLGLSHKESNWWSFIKDRQNILKLPSEDFDVVIKAYFLRYDIKFGDQEAKKEYYDLLSTLSEEDRERLTPLLGEITKHLAS